MSQNYRRTNTEVSDGYPIRRHSGIEAIKQSLVHSQNINNEAIANLNHHQIEISQHLILFYYYYIVY